MLATDRILSLDIGASTVKVGEFQVSKAHGLRLTNFNYADLGLDPEHEENRKALVVSTVRNVLREKDIKSSRVIFSVSGQSVFTRFVKLPPVDESKVTQIIQYEAQQNVPFPIDEVIWDYQLVGNSEQGELEVVLLAIKSDIIEELNQGIESAGLRTEMVDVAPMALYNAVRYNDGETEGCTLVVDIGARTTNLLFMEKNRVFSRSIPIAGNTITQSIAAEFNVSFLEAEQLKKMKGFVALGGAYEEPPDEQQARVSKIIRHVMTRLHADIGRSINFYRGQQNGSAPARLLLSGGSSILPYTDRFFQEKLQVPVEYFNPFRNVEIDPQLSREELVRCAHFFGEVVGLGLRKLSECPLEVDLLPKSIQRRKQMEQKRPYLAGAAVALLLIPICWLAYTKRTAALRQQQFKEVRTQLEGLQSLERVLGGEQVKLSELKDKADELVTLIHQRSLWPELLQDINQRMVPHLWITSLGPCGGAAPGAPVPAGGRRGRRAAPSSEEPVAQQPALAPTGPTTIAALRLEGEGVRAAGGEDLRMVDEFRSNLAASKYFDKDHVEIELPPNPMEKRPVFSFRICAKLAQPIKTP